MFFVRVKSSFSDDDTRGCGASRPGVIRNFLDDCLNEESKQGTQVRLIKFRLAPVLKILLVQSLFSTKKHFFFLIDIH